MRNKNRQYNFSLWTNSILIIACFLGLPACATLITESEHGNTAAVQKDLSNGAYANQVEESSNATALIFAAQNGYYDVVKILLRYGADPNQPSDFIENWGGFAGQGIHLCAGHARKTGGKCDLGWLAKRTGENYDEAVVSMIKEHKYTALFLAANNGHYDVVKLLLEYGANPIELIESVTLSPFNDPNSLQSDGLSLSLNQVSATAAANGIDLSKIDSIRASHLLESEPQLVTRITHELFPATKHIRLFPKGFYRDLNRPKSINYDDYSNEYFWMTKKSRISRKWGMYFQSSYTGKRDDLNFLSVSEQIIKGDYLKEVQDRMQGQSLPELDIKQSRFESTRHYLHREESAKEELTSYKNTLSRNEQKAYSTVESREKLIIYRLFVLYFGQPIITNISYDPDSRLFGLQVEGQSGGVFRFILADRIMNEVAPVYERKIRKASVKILIRASGGRLYIDGGSLVFPDGATERILPFHEEDYHLKDVTIASFPKIKVPEFSSPEKILPNKRMKSEGKRIVNETVYFQGLK